MRAARTGCVAWNAWRAFGAALIVTVVLVVSACIGDAPVHKSTVQAGIATAAAPIVIGRTDRAAVRQALGEPWASSEYWRFDLFRISDSNFNMVVFFIPVWVSRDDMAGYVLVAYDEEGRVAAYDHGLASKGLGGFSRDTAERASLQAGDIRFGASGERGEEFLSVAAVLRDDYLRAPPPGDSCRVLIGCAQDWCGTRVTIDGKPHMVLPDTLTGFPSIVAPLELRPGEHRVDIEPIRRSYAFDASARFACEAGESVFALIDIRDPETPVTGFTWKRPFAASITISRDRPEAFGAQTLLIWRDGRWLVPEEPSQ